MHGKSDIESILESQTWKIIHPRESQRIRLKFKPPKKLKPFECKSTLQSIEVSEVQESAKPDIRVTKSLLAIPFNSLNARISKIIADEEVNAIKIPTFPRLPFGVHKDMLSQCPTFEVIPREFEYNSDNIKAIKLESGRIRKAIAQGIIKPLQRIKRLKQNKSEQFYSSRDCQLATMSGNYLNH